MLTILFILSSLFVQTLPQNNEGHQDLTIRVAGLESSEGQIRIAVFNSPDGFLERPFKQKIVPVDDQKQVEAIFSVPEGEYAVAVYHDKNKNGELDKNFLGIPTEAYGFSNDARGTRLGAPSFEDTRISLKQSSQTVQVEVR